MSAPKVGDRRFRRGEDPTGALRFALRTQRDGTCLRWTGTLDNKGYGMLSINGRLRRAHIYSYERVYGPVPDGLELDHVAARGCRFRDCVEPEHLEAVTHHENVLRSRSATHCRAGHKMTPDNRIQRPSGAGLCRICRDQRAACPSCGVYVNARHMASHEGARYCRLWSRTKKAGMYSARHGRLVNTLPEAS